MLRDEVLGIFGKKKHDYLRIVVSDTHPIGILLGGQGAVGKGQLNHWAEYLFHEKSFLFINGDLYRNRHPNFNELRNDLWNYLEESEKTLRLLDNEMVSTLMKNAHDELAKRAAM